MNILKVVKNEFIKLIHQKKFIILFVVILSLCILAAYGYSDMRNDVLKHTAKSEDYDNSFKALITNLNYIRFSILFSGDFIYKPLLPIYLIFIAIIFTSVLSEDYLEGTMKFSLVSPITKSQLILGKLLFMLVISSIVALFNLAISLIIGYITFGGANLISGELLKVISIYILSIAPVMAFGTIVLLISLIVKNTGTVISTTIVLAIILNIVDYFTKTKDFSPIGLLAKFSNGYYVNISDGIVPIIFAVVYIALFSTIILFKVKNEDVVY